MTVQTSDFRNRVEGLLGREGVVLTDREMSRITDRYPLCGGREPWDVREYARHDNPGAREYRVLRGRRVQDVYASVERERAAAVQYALNEMESQDEAGDRSG
jgi:hypothetical protein